MRSSILAIGVFVAVLLVGAAAFALNGYAHGQEPVASTPAAPPGLPGQFPMMDGMGGMMGSNGYAEQPVAGPQGGMGSSGQEGCPMEDIMDEMIGMEAMDDEAMDFRGLNMVEVNGTVVEVIDRDNKIVVDTGNNNVTVKVLNMYVDVSNGYLFSGVWLVEQLEDLVDSGATVQVSITGAGGGYGVAALSITVDGIGSYAVPMYYDLSR